MRYLGDVFIRMVQSWNVAPVIETSPIVHPFVTSSRIDGTLTFIPKQSFIIVIVIVVVVIGKNTMGCCNWNR